MNATMDRLSETMGRPFPTEEDMSKGRVVARIGTVSPAIKAKKIYLAGPITGLTYKGAQDWRTAVKAELDALPGVVAYTPLRLKEFLDDDRVIKGHENSRNWIVARDRWDVSTADVVLANLAGAPVASVGTVSEITQAAGQPHTFTIGVLPEAERDSNPHHHIFVYHLLDAIVEDLEEAVNLIKIL